MDLSVPVYRHDGSGCFVVYVGEMPCAYTYSKSRARWLCQMIRDDIPYAVLKMVEDDTIPIPDGMSEFGLSGLGMSEWDTFADILERWEDGR